MLVVRYYKYSAKDDTYVPNFIFCDSIESSADGNVRLLACDVNPNNPRATVIIKASQLISIRVKEKDNKTPFDVIDFINRNKPDIFEPF